jgi:nuclear RNA export factor
MNGYGWAGTNVTIERVGGSKEPTEAVKSAAEETKAMLRGVLERRYNFETKMLDLSSLSQDEELNKANIFDKSSTTRKIFPAMMKVLELSFDTEAERHAAITSVSLANNGLVDLTDITSLAPTLPKLHNLDLSNNALKDLNSLQNWRKKFYHLQHLIISSNPLEQNEPDYPAEIVKWYPNLRMLNNVQVRTEEEIAKKASPAELPFPIRTALFQDEGGIAETFVRTFFAGFDNDRGQLAAHYYDEQSDFSFAINTQAPRDPAATETTEKQEWDQYIKNSRNLKKISHLPARQNRHFRGPKAVAEMFAGLPKTKHPDLAAEARKWLVEAHIQPGVPDASGQSSAGVDGFMIIIHGEFEEVDGSGQAKKKRSFDRTFVIGPGGPSGVRIVNDMLTIRAYGGAQAFETDNFESWNTEVQATNNTAEAVPQLPAGLTVETAEKMVMELQKQTGMTVAYSKDCLEQVGWDFQKALDAFASVKGNLPAEAFVQAV